MDRIVGCQRFLSQARRCGARPARKADPQVIFCNREPVEMLVD